MKRTTGRGPKDKGRAFENEIRTALLKALPSLSPSEITPRSMGDPGVDLILSQAARDLIPFAFELKRTERLNLNEALAQSETNAEKEHLPALPDIQA